MFYQARYYDPLVGRFISADTIVPDPADPQQLNRYSYVRNNPVSYVDPTGHCTLPSGAVAEDTSTRPCTAVAGGGKRSGGIGPADFIAGRMVDDALSDNADFIRDSLAPPSLLSQVASALACDGTPLCYSGGKELTGAVYFASLVRGGSSWDYKGEIKRKFGESWVLPDGDEWFHDVWTNIHYGYVGSSVGFSRDELQLAARMGETFEQGSIPDRATEAFFGENDVGDVLSVDIGVFLWNEHGLDLTVDDVMAVVEEWQPVYERIYDLGLTDIRRVW